MDDQKQSATMISNQSKPNADSSSGLRGATPGASHACPPPQDCAESRRLETLLLVQHRLDAMLSFAGELSSSLPYILQTLCELEGLDCGGVHRFDAATESLDLLAYHDWSAEFASAVSHWPTASPEAQLIRRGNVYQGSSTDLWSSRQDRRAGEGLRAVLLLPLVHQGRLLGALLDLYPTASRTEVARYLAEAAAGPASSLNCPLLKKDGTRWNTEFPILERACVARGPDGRPQRIFGMMQDVTAQIEAEERLRSLQLHVAHLERVAIVGELVAGIAHEVNQPLHSILNFAKACSNVLLKPQPRLDDVLEWTREIATAAQRGGDIIKRLRTFLSRPDRELHPVCIDGMVEETLTTSERAVLERLLQGLVNKQIAKQLSVSLRTVESRRHEIMVKLGVKSLPELFRLMTPLATFPPQ